MKKRSQRNILAEEQSKDSSLLDPALLYNKDFPITEEKIKDFIVCMDTFIDRNPRVIHVYHIYNELKVTERVYYKLLKKYTQMQEAHERLLRSIGMRIQTYAFLDHKNYTVLKPSMWRYGKDFAEDEERAEAFKHSIAEAGAPQLQPVLPPIIHTDKMVAHKAKKARLANANKS